MRVIQSRLAGWVFVLSLAVGCSSNDSGLKAGGGKGGGGGSNTGGQGEPQTGGSSGSAGSGDAFKTGGSSGSAGSGGAFKTGGSSGSAGSGGAFKTGGSSGSGGSSVECIPPPCVPPGCGVGYELVQPNTCDCSGPCGCPCGCWACVQTPERPDASTIPDAPTTRDAKVPDAPIVCPAIACVLPACAYGTQPSPEPCGCPICKLPPDGIDGGKPLDGAAGDALGCLPVACPAIACAGGVQPSPTPCGCPICVL